MGICLITLSTRHVCEVRCPPYRGYHSLITRVFEIRKRQGTVATSTNFQMPTICTAHVVTKHVLSWTTEMFHLN